MGLTITNKRYKVAALGIRIIILCFLAAALASCAAGYSRFSVGYAGLFDTYCEIIGYARGQKEFDRYAGIIRARLEYLHGRYDIYNGYDGVNNLKTVNENAGKDPVKVDGEIIGLLEFGKRMYRETGGAVDITLGPVLKIWHDYREQGLLSPGRATLPPMDELRAASGLAGIDDLVIDRGNSTVYLAREGMSLDVGAIAKGFAASLAVSDAKKAGMTSALVDVGGNISAVGAPLDASRDTWSVGVKDPENSGEAQKIADTVLVKDLSVATSGDYQRFYTVGGKRYNHIIDAKTLMPAVHCSSVTVIAPDPGVADALSTCLFILPFDEGVEAASRAGCEAIWIYKDGSVKTTGGYRKLSQTY